MQTKSSNVGLLLFVAFCNYQLASTHAETTFTPDAYKVAWYHLDHVAPANSGIVLSAEAVETTILPLQPIRVRIRLSNPTSHTVGPLPHPGLHARINGSQAPDRSTFEYRANVVPALEPPELRQGAHYSAPFSRLVGVWLQAGESVTYSLTFTATNPLTLHPTPGDYQYRIRYGHIGPVDEKVGPADPLDLTTSFAVTVSEPKGEDENVQHVLLSNAEILRAMMSPDEISEGKTRDSIEQLLSRYPKSAYADFARFALARSYVKDRIVDVDPTTGKRRLHLDTERAAEMVLGIDFEAFAYLPQLEEILRRVSVSLPPDRKVFLKSLPRTLCPDAFELTIWANGSVERDKVNIEIRTPFIRNSVKQIRPNMTYQHALPVTSIRLGDSKFAILTDETVLVFDLRTGKRIETQRVFSATMFDFSDEIIAAVQEQKGVRGTARIMLLSGDNKNVSQIGSEKKRASSIALTPSGDRVIVGLASRETSHLEIWNAKTGEMLEKIRERAPNVIALSRTNDLMAIDAVDNSVVVLNCGKQAEPIRLPSDAHTLTALAFSPNGGTIAACYGNSTVKIWDVAKVKCVATLRDHRGGTFSACFSPDGQFLATSGADSCVRVYDSKTYTEIAALVGHANAVLDARFASDSRTVMSAGADGAVNVWDIKGLKK